MAYPKIYEKLFQSDGAGSLLRSDIIPTVEASTKLATARSLQANLASTDAASFDGSADASIGVSGVLPVANGGTGASSLSSITVGEATKATQDGSGNVITSTYLPLSGGTMTGALIDKQSYEILGVPNTAAAHNCIYRGKDLTSTYTVDQICTKLTNNDFSDLFIGDYITKTFTNPSGNSETADFVFAGFDYWLHSGGGDTYTRKQDYTISNYECDFHHILMVPKDCFATTAQMNSSNTTAGCYIGSAMNTLCKTYATKLSASNVFGSHIKVFTNWENGNMVSTYASAAGANLMGSTTFYNNGQAGYDWAAHKVRLMTEPMVFGGTVFSSSGYEVGCGKAQLPLFSLNPRDIIAGLGRGGGRCPWWLSAVASSTDFALVHGVGDAFSSGASTALGVRPFFLIG